MSVMSDKVWHHGHNAESAVLRGLLVRDPYASQLLDREKIREIRGRPTHIRGPILIVKSGTGQLLRNCQELWMGRGSAFGGSIGRCVPPVGLEPTLDGF